MLSLKTAAETIRLMITVHGGGAVATNEAVIEQRRLNVAALQQRHRLSALK